MPKPIIREGKLVENKVLIESSRLRDQLSQKGFGELIERKLVLELKEAIYLVEKKKLKVKKGRRVVSAAELLELGETLDKRFYSKYLVFRDLRDKGYVVKTGYKFGFDLRVYPRGKKPGEAHTQWVVNVCAQDDTFSMPEISRMVRLSGNINTVLVQAVVDSEDDITYYEIKRIIP
ncbi:MAG: tRNA-intron lyase [Candidatus Diapherotrites archaeon]|nr:tRNA-intron lyase [Candidatus Diapherotrites archaeon]